MNLDEFKELAKKTNLPLNHFYYTDFIKCYVAENHSKKKFASIHYPNKHGGATLQTGWGNRKKIHFLILWNILCLSCRSRKQINILESKGEM